MGHDIPDSASTPVEALRWYTDRVVDAAWVVADTQRQGTPEWLAALRALATAVDALGGDHPAEPAPEPAGGPGWVGRPDRECGEHRTTGKRAWCHDCTEWCYSDVPCARCELPALRADRDRQAEAYGEVLVDGYMVVAQRDAARAELVGQREAARRARHQSIETVSRLEDRAEAAEAEADRLRAELAEASVELDELRGRVNVAVDAGAELLADEQGEVDRLRAELATARRDAQVERQVAAGCRHEADRQHKLADLHADRAAYLTDQLAEATKQRELDRTLSATARRDADRQVYDRVTAALTDVRRDAAADALSAFAVHVRGSGLTPLAIVAGRWAAEYRADERPVPGSPEPAGGGDDASEG